MSDLKARNFIISNDDLEYIDKVKKEKGLHNRSESLRLIISQHQEQQDMTIKNLYEVMAEKIAEILKPILNSLRYSSNKTNEEVQVLTELINAIYINNNYPSIVPDSESKPHGALTKSKSNVKERILKQAYIKQNRLD